MFWEWFWDLYFMTYDGIQPCPKCHLHPSSDCGYLIQDVYLGEYDCEAPDAGELGVCEGCHHLTCDNCKGV